VLRSALLAVSRSRRLEHLVADAPISRDVVRRFVAGSAATDAVAAARRLADQGLSSSVDNLGEDVTDLDAARATVAEYQDLLTALADAGLTRPGHPGAEVSVKLSALGLGLPDGEDVAARHAFTLCNAARRVGTTVTIDMEGSATTAATLRVLARVRADFPDTGGVLQSYLHRSEADCAALATAGSRIRLCKGAYDEPADVAYVDRHAIDLAYVRCLKVLMAGKGYPMVATHDPRLVAIASAVAGATRRAPGSYEFQMLHGVRPEEQIRLASTGETVRVYLPYGTDWYGYMVRRMAEKPANVRLFLSALKSTR
jgi:proline dehydrogenase